MVDKTTTSALRNIFEAPQPTLMLVLDALGLGWGAHLSPLKTQGVWTAKELALHIKLRERRVIHLTCVVFLPQLSNKVEWVLMDNTALVYYINR